MANLKIAVLLSGGGTTLQNLIDYRHAGKLSADIELVISSQANALGLARAKNAGIETAMVASKKFRQNGVTDWDAMAQELNAILLPRNFDLICLAGFMCFYPLPPELNNRVINIHPALLPAFGGAGMYGPHVHHAVKKSGVNISGCTVHFVNNVYDAGVIILQRSCPVFATDTAEEIAKRVFVEECIALPAAINRIAKREGC